MNFLLIFIAFLSATFLTKITREFALKKAIIDIPNERSLHTIPIPRGGGLAFVTVFLSGLLYFSFKHQIDFRLNMALLGGILIAYIGYRDDISPIKARWRFLIHILAALWAVFWLGSLKIELKYLGGLVSVLGMVWCVNLYNFMDGIDGLASSEGIFATLAASIPLYFLGEINLVMIFLFLAATILGFVIWNWEPAKIFMGDIGSGFLGYVFGVLALYTVNKNYLSIPFWLIIFAVFIADTAFTLLYRIFKKKSWCQAHKDHVYQHLIKIGITHSDVNFGICLFNVFILLPLALFFLYHPLIATKFILTGIFILWFIWFWIKSYNV